ncbi:SAM-dependent methyltransferase [Actinomadura atramentaria]|uniref:SAM-dependent methyltransferase n=1 Tax=Actinomadura atramentaria TaxID=1990 RepID=UPI00039C6BEA|nr:SAM-dependent methyltransferase [Actinomadura atramentaria]
MTTDEPFVDIPTDVPTSARIYAWNLGGKDNFEIDRQFALRNGPAFPETVDITRQNRLFLYRAVRYLAVEAGIRQFVDLGCGLPTENNVHQVAQRFAPDARVVYVDVDPIVAVHARALLADDDSTAFVTADMRDQEAIIEHPKFRRLIDLDEPVAVLFLSVGHHLPDADDPRRVLRAVIDRAPVNSHLVFTQVAYLNAERGAAMTELMNSAGIPWQTRSPAEIDALLDGFEPVAPGLGDVKEWRPDPDQPPLAPVPAELADYVGASERRKELIEYGGVLRKAD